MCEKNMEIEKLKNELDALEILVMKERKVWYKDYSLIISMIALLLSFGTTYLSQQRIKAQDIQAAKLELRNTLKQISELQRQSFDIIDKFKNNPSIRLSLSSQLAHDNALMLAQIVDLVDKIPSNEISPIDYYSIATILFADKQYNKAAVSYKLAYENSFDNNLIISAARGCGASLFTIGNIELGRKEYEKAFETKLNNNIENQTSEIITLLNWANAEYMAQNIHEALKKVEKARGIMLKIPNQYQSKEIKEQIENMHKVLTNIKIENE